ncbi:methyltransferase domain-containing protein [Amycolatopsis sp. NPDC059021]|uniref:methyltransferase domain-containing protein n=1 Tax=Amycolatopsis sp. NPDC059021 TaxID=3346704 RepID=UPI00366E7C5C
MTDQPSVLDEVPRELFIPEVIWDDNPDGHGFVPVSRTTDRQRWLELVNSTGPIVTQVDDGHPVDGIGRVPTSSSSQPSLVAMMLDELDVKPGHQVLEIGTGTGWNAALLAHRAGPDGRVVSVEVDGQVADKARAALAVTPYRVTVIEGDGTAGFAAGAPYDRVIATASVRRVPTTWIEQTVEGGVLVLPWGTDYCNGALLRLVVHGDGQASGRFGRSLEFMRVRNQRNTFLDPSDEQIEQADKSTTTLRGGDVYELVAFERAAFIIGLRVPACYLTHWADIDVQYRHIVEFHDTASGSWARIDTDPRADALPVWQFGPRRLWDEALTAYEWWQHNGQPPPQSFGLTVAPDGTQTVWLEKPTGHGWEIQ